MIHVPVEAAKSIKSAAAEINRPDPVSVRVLSVKNVVREIIGIYFALYRIFIKFPLYRIEKRS